MVFSRQPSFPGTSVELRENYPYGRIIDDEEEIFREIFCCSIEETDNNANFMEGMEALERSDSDVNSPIIKGSTGTNKRNGRFQNSSNKNFMNIANKINRNESPSKFKGQGKRKWKFDPALKFMGLGKRHNMYDPAIKFMGLGKREDKSYDPALRVMGLGKRNQMYDPAMKYMGLGKRENKYDPAIRYMGLGKRNNDNMYDPAIRYMGLGKRSEMYDPAMRYMGLGKRKNAYDPAMRYMGLGKRNKNVYDLAVRYMGLGKRNKIYYPAMRYMGLGKRKNYYDPALRYMGLGKRNHMYDPAMRFMGLGKRNQMYDPAMRYMSLDKRSQMCDPPMRYTGLGKRAQQYYFAENPTQLDKYNPAYDPLLMYTSLHENGKTRNAHSPSNDRSKRNQAKVLNGQNEGKVMYNAKVNFTNPTMLSANYNLPSETSDQVKLSSNGNDIFNFFDDDVIEKENDQRKQLYISVPSLGNADFGKRNSIYSPHLKHIGLGKRMGAITSDDTVDATGLERREQKPLKDGGDKSTQEAGGDRNFSKVSETEEKAQRLFKRDLTDMFKRSKNSEFNDINKLKSAGDSEFWKFIYNICTTVYNPVLDNLSEAKDFIKDPVTGAFPFSSDPDHDGHQKNLEPVAHWNSQYEPIFAVFNTKKRDNRPKYNPGWKFIGLGKRNPVDPDMEVLTREPRHRPCVSIPIVRKFMRYDYLDSGKQKEAKEFAGDLGDYLNGYKDNYDVDHDIKDSINSLIYSWVSFLRDNPVIEELKEDHPLKLSISSTAFDKKNGDQSDDNEFSSNPTVDYGWL